MTSAKPNAASAVRMPNSGAAHGESSFAERISALDGTQPVLKGTPPTRVTFDERHLGLDCGADVGAHQVGTAGADDHQVAVASGFILVQTVCLCSCVIHFVENGDQLWARRARKPPRSFGDDRKHAKQRTGNQSWERIPDSDSMFASCVPAFTNTRRSSQHSQLADPIEGGGAAAWAHHEADHEEGKGRHQSKSEEIETPSRSMPALMALSCRRSVPGPSREAIAGQLEGEVAPTLEAKETSRVPHHRPKTAPTASVMMAAPGSDSG